MNQQQQESLQAFALLFHFIDGQKPRMPHVDAGLFGTYTCYTHFTSVFMLPMKYLRTQHLEEFHQSVLIIFALCPRTGFYYGLVIESRWTDLVGQVVHVNMVSRNFIRYGLFLPWLEQYVSDLVDRQQYDIIGEDRVLSMFKNHAPPYTSRALSRGVLCEVSTHCMLETISPSLPWVYRVKFQLSTDGIESPRVCQLIRRRWAVRYQSGLVKHVADELVVGQMPVLRVDSPLFTYCSICGGHAHGEEGLMMH
jgi:uncharacterized protein affecting Mg2+/Co2+ transport